MTEKRCNDLKMTTASLELIDDIVDNDDNLLMDNNDVENNMCTSMTSTMSSVSTNINQMLTMASSSSQLKPISM